MSFEFDSRSSAERAGRKRNCFKAVMHFSFYLMIAALVVVGLEVAYALYQLATFVL